MERQKNINTLNFDGGHLCFDFVNTVDSRKEIDSFDYLSSYNDFLKWCIKLEIIDENKSHILNKYAEQHPTIAKHTINNIKETREILYRIFEPIALDKISEIPSNSLKNFNSCLKNTLSHFQLELKENKLQTSWNNQKVELEEPLWVIIKAAYDLLINEDYNRIKKCGACEWLFLDQTKNKKRRWCNASTCGSIEKSKRYYQKKKRTQK